MAHLQKEEFAYDQEKGRRLWQKALREYQKKYRLTFNDADLQARLAAAGFPDLEAFLRVLGGGRKALNRQTLKKIFPELGAVEVAAPRRAAPRLGALHSLIKVDGQSDIDFILAKCCHPIKGEEIVGYITKARGLVIHKKSCPNVNKDMPSRLKPVAWNDASDYAYQVKLELLVADKPGVLSTITGITAASNSNIKRLNQEPASQGMVKIVLLFEVRDMFQLNGIFSQFKKVPDIYAINRRKTSEK